MSIMTYQELRDALLLLTKEQLKQPVAFLGEDSPGAPLRHIWIVEEDQINPSGEGMEPISVYKDDPDYADEPVVCKAGTIILMETQETP